MLDWRFPDPLVLLLDTAVQVTAIALLALVALRTISRKSPAARHSIAFCALLCILASPAIAGGVERAGTPLLGGSAWTSTAESDQPLRSVLSRDPEAVGIQVSSRSLGWALGILWVMGVGILSVRSLAGMREVVRMRRSAVPLDLRHREEFLEQVRASVGMRVLPVIATSPRVRRPLVLGPFQPMVLLPEGLAEQLSGSSLRDVLIHECAHLAQGHHLLAAFQHLATILFWPHPLVHQLGKELGRAREEVCDNYVIASGDPIGYARTLLAVASGGTLGASPVPAERAEPPAATSMNRNTGSTAGVRRPFIGRRRDLRRWTLAGRVEGLLDAKRERQTRWCRWKQVLAASGFLFVGTSVSTARVTQAALQEPPAPVIRLEATSAQQSLKTRLPDWER